MVSHTLHIPLMSPPEGKIADSFDVEPKMRSDTTIVSKLNTTPQASSPLRRASVADAVDVPPSPPESPWTAIQKKIQVECGDEVYADQDIHSTKDPVLYPHSAMDLFEQPLFDQKTEDEEPFHSINRAPPKQEPKDKPVLPLGRPIQFQLISPKRKISSSQRKRPCLSVRQDPGAAVPLIPAIGKCYNLNSGAYLKGIMDEDKDLFQRRRRLSIQDGQVETARRTARNVNAVSSPSRSDRHLQRKKASTRRLQGLKRISTATTSDRQVTGKSRPSFLDKTEITDFQKLPDYSPSTSNLNDAKALKIDWSSTNPLDLSCDPYYHLLHPAERHLASTLRLTCSSYLKNKRLIFLKVHEVHAKGKEFRKTDAQQACVIDVNKASKLWIAFEKVGWFDRNSLEKFWKYGLPEIHDSV